MPGEHAADAVDGLMAVPVRPSPNIVHGVLVDERVRGQDCESVYDGVADQKPVEGVAVQLRKALEEIDICIRKRAVEKMVLCNGIRHELVWGDAEREIAVAIFDLEFKRARLVQDELVAGIRNQFANPGRKARRLVAHPQKGTSVEEKVHAVGFVAGIGKTGPLWKSFSVSGSPCKNSNPTGQRPFMSPIFRLGRLAEEVPRGRISAIGLFLSQSTTGVPLFTSRV